jgi:hypothetical protein
MFMMANWTFLTNHAWALLCIAHDPKVRLRDIAASRDITERRAYGTITDLASFLTPGSIQHPAGPAWRQVLTAHARGILAAGFGPAGTVPLRRLYAVIIIGHGIGRAHLAGVTAHPDGSWTTIRPGRNTCPRCSARAGRRPRVGDRKLGGLTRLFTHRDWSQPE